MALQKHLLVFSCALALAACGGNAPEAPGERQATMSASQRAVAADPAAYTALVQQLYVAFFGRPADPDGLAFHAATLARLQAPDELRAMAAAYGGNADVRAVIDSLANSPEAQDLYGGAPERLISALYRNSFNRDPDAPGLRFWLDAITTHGLSTGAAVTTILEGARGSDLLTFERKAAAARLFTGALDGANARALYSGHGPNALVRDLLAATRSASTDSEIGAAIDTGIGALRAGQGWIMRDGYAEVPGGARSIVLLAAPRQYAIVRQRLDTLAGVLAADLNARAGLHGPRWSVEVVQAAASVPAVRAQLQGRDGAILIGDVIMPTRVDLITGATSPDLTPYRTPQCTRYRFPSGQAVVEPARGSDQIWVNTQDPACRNGMALSVLRSVSETRQETDLMAKLDQMIAYHRSREQSNANWNRAYQRINALWVRDDTPRDGLGFWNDIPLFDRARIRYLETGTGQERLDALRTCLASGDEMCTFSGHGSDGFIVAEGPDPDTPMYSRDAVHFSSSELAANPVRAKFINMQSCSTQNFLQPGSFGTSLLMDGQAMLVMGSTMAIFQSNLVDKEAVQSMYQSLAHGATFAEAFAGKLDQPFWGLQGDPFVSLRPKPGGPQPKLVVDGKHYNVNPAVSRLTLGDSNGDSISYRTVTLANRGDAELRLRLNVYVTEVSAPQIVNPNGGQGFNSVFQREAPDANRDNVFGNVGDIVHVLPPGGELQLRLSFEALVNTTTWQRSRGLHTATYEIHANDPQSPRIVFELAANAN